MSGLDLVLYLGVVGRLVRLVTVDDFPPVASSRSWLVTHLPETLAEGLTCPWCVSVWIGAAVAWGWWAIDPSPWLVVPLVASLASGLLAGVWSD